MVHVRGACAQQLPMSAPWCQLVFSNRIITLRHVQKRLKLELAVQKVFGVNMKQSLRRPWDGRCVNMRLSLCLIFWSTQETTLIVRDTRSRLTQPAAKLGARPKLFVLALLCGHGHDRSPQKHLGGSRSEAPVQGERERAERAKQRGRCRAARDSLGKAGPQERARDQGVANVRDSGLGGQL